MPRFVTYLFVSVVMVSAGQAFAAHGPSSRRAKWDAPRGNAGKAPPRCDAEWGAFNGKVSVDGARVMSLSSHKDPVPLTGIRRSVAAPNPLGLEDIGRDLVRRTGTHPAIALRAAPNVALGLPSDADRTATDDRMVVYKDRVLSYSNTRRTPNWVAWRISKSDLGSVPRSDALWRADPSLPKGSNLLAFHDYDASGFDPGHMVASADRRSTPRANARTYVTSNTVPQSFNNNRGPWTQMEMWIRDQVAKNNQDAYIIAGGTYGQAPYKIGSGTSVPNATWKVVAFLNHGQSISDITAKTRVVAVNVPNDDRVVQTSEAFSRYITTPAEIERQTGLSFFTNLPSGVADALRNRREDASGIQAPQPNY